MGHQFAMSDIQEILSPIAGGHTPVCVGLVRLPALAVHCEHTAHLPLPGVRDDQGSGTKQLVCACSAVGGCHCICCSHFLSSEAEAVCHFCHCPVVPAAAAAAPVLAAEAAVAGSYEI